MMRVEIENWWKQALADLHSAKNCFKSGDYYLASFACQQAIEKGLKALYLLKKKFLPVGHSLVYLAKELQIPKDIFNCVVRLNSEYITTRYPDVANAAPVDVYTKEISLEHLSHAGMVITWLEKQIKK